MSEAVRMLSTPVPLTGQAHFLPGMLGAAKERADLRETAPTGNSVRYR